jgi:hypothetical protein
LAAHLDSVVQAAVIGNDGSEAASGGRNPVLGSNRP